MKLIKNSSANSNSFKLNINKQEWIDIGTKAQWFQKTAESYTSKGGINFYVGGTLNTRGGMLTIESIDVENKLMSVRKENGSTAMYDMDTLAEVSDVESYILQKQEQIREEEEAHAAAGQEREERVRRRNERRERLPRLFADEELYHFMGLIAAKGTIGAQVPDDKMSNFEKTYRDIKKRPMSHEIFEKIDQASSSQKWFLQLRVHLPKSVFTQDELLMAQNLGFELKQTQSSYDINDTAFVKRLMGLGFDIGKNTNNADLIASSIETSYGETAKEKFEEGYVTY